MPTAVLDFDFTCWLTANVKEMKTKQFWQPALRELYTDLAPDDRKVALNFLLDAIKRFQVFYINYLLALSLHFFPFWFPSLLLVNPLPSLSAFCPVSLIITSNFCYFPLFVFSLGFFPLSLSSPFFLFNSYHFFITLVSSHHDVFTFRVFSCRLCCGLVLSLICFPFLS